MIRQGCFDRWVILKLKDKLSENEKKHVVNTITLALPKQDELFTKNIMNVRGASGYEMMGIEKPRFGTVGAGLTTTLDRPPEIIGQFQVSISCWAITVSRPSYCKKTYLVYMREENFNNLLSSLNNQEREIFDSHRGTKRLWRWNGDRFKASISPKETMEALSEKILSASEVVARKVKNNEAIYAKALN